jgi:predicted nucleic acid-binding protein
MIYVDTSVMVKLYVREERSQEVSEAALSIPH